MFNHELFSSFIQNISIDDYSDINKKFEGLTKCLNTAYYQVNDSFIHSKKVGSIGRGSCISTISDLDMLFEIPEATYKKFRSYETNGQSQLLQEVKSIISATYPKTEIKGDGQVVVVDFKSQHVEVLPAYYIGNSTYHFPDTKSGGKWQETKPDLEIAEIKSFDATCKGILLDLCKMIRAWKDESGINIGGLLIDTFCFNFLNNLTQTDWSTYRKNYFLMCLHFFKYLSEMDDNQEYYMAFGSNQRVYRKGKFSRKAKKTYQKLLTMDKEQVFHLRSIFGQKFPKLQLLLSSESRNDSAYRKTEEFIEDFYLIDISFDLQIDCIVKQDGFRPALLSSIGILKAKKDLEFFIEDCNVPLPYDVKWKVRNTGPEAKRRDCIRGQIVNSDKDNRKKEPIPFPS